jgi:hypothetical protein
MSKIEVDTIDTQSSTTLQVGSTNTSLIKIGTSGDTVEYPAGTTFTQSGTQNVTSGGAINVKSGGSIIIDSGAAITNNGTATGFSADLTNLNATNLTSGTVPDARFPATLPAANGSALTNLNATALTSGTIPAARISSLPAGVGGKVGQMISTQLASVQSTTSQTFVPITGVTNTITPTATSSKVWIQGTLLWGRSTNNTMWMQMFRGSTLINEQTFSTGSETDSFYASGTNSGYYVLRQAPFSFLDSPSTTSATTYTIKWRVDGNTIWLNRIGADTNQGGTSQLNTLEILA